MSTHVDGASPAVAPEPDDPERDGGADGTEWVRAEMARRMAANRSVRGRHARRSEDARSEQRDAPADARRRVDTPPRPWTAAAAAPPPEPPENYVPRHSVLTPGPAAEPATPTGPVPAARPDGSAVGGPSLPSGLPVRRKRTGPGTPLRSDARAPVGPWSGPSPVVSPEPALRLGAPPEAPVTPEPVPAWGLPLATPVQGMAVVGAAAPVEPPAAAPPADEAPGESPAADDERAAADDDTLPGTDRAPAYDDDTHETDEDAADDDDTADAADVDDAPPPVPAQVAAAAPAANAADVVDPPTAPHPIVLPRRTVVPGRTLGVPAQRGSEARVVTPRPLTPRQIPVVGTAPPEPGSTRVRVVLSERKGVARPVRTIKEVQEGTAVGELLRRNLIRSQLRVTLRFALLTVVVLGSLPVLFALLPEVSRFEVFGLRLPWILLGFLMYPFLVGVAWCYTRLADRVEQNFADHVQD